MRCRWNPIGFQFFCFMFLIIGRQIRSSRSLNSEGIVLLKFQARVISDPHGTLANWNAGDSNPCSWSGVTCVEGKVQMLDLGGSSLEGTLAPEISQLRELRFLILSKNHFSGGIPEEFGSFSKLEILDLRNNDLSGKIPTELCNMLSLKHMLLSGNKLEGKLKNLRRLSLLSEFQFNESLEPPKGVGLGCSNRKFGHCVLRGNFRRVKKAEAFILRIKSTSRHYINAFSFKMFRFRRDSHPDHAVNYVANLPNSLEETSTFRRRQLLEQSSNLAAVPAPSDTIPSPAIAPEVFPRSSGAFPAVPNAKKRKPPLISPEANTLPNTKSHSMPNPPEKDRKSSAFKDVWMYVIIGLASFVGLLILIALILLCRKRAVKSVGPWKTGLSGQLQKAFVTGVPKLNRSELETACEDFSNIIDTFDGYTVYKGTLSSGVEIAVASTAISSSNEWTQAMEMAYRRKIDSLSRINHKNFVNLIGYCEEDEPFNRMMVFEYAPNGTLFEHLHVKEMEHLDWNARMRITMGTAYCLQYMHDLNPPMAHSILCSSAIFLTDDYAAKVAEVCFNTETGLKPKKTASGELDHSVLPILPEPETNVYRFGVLLLEIISGKLPYSDEEGSIEQWASVYLESENFLEMIDPTLKTFKEEELEVICDVVQQCLKPDPRRRPTMKDIIDQLKQVINISPDQSTPRLSPLWWAELEILSSEAT